MSRLLAFTLTPLALVAGIVTATAAPAAALDGRVPDGRSADPRGEVTAYYWHGLNRDPDTGGLNNYVSFTNQDCRWGVQDAGIKLLDSGEAHRKWPTTQQKVGALYASLLNRAPDPGGFNAYVNAINGRGVRWSITAMQASDEFHARLDRICGGRKSTNATVWNSENAIRQAIQINNGAADLVKACGVGLLVNTFAPIRALSAAPALIKASKLAAGQALKVAGGACVGAYYMLSAADKVAITADYTRDNNPVFLQSDTRSYWNAIGKWCETWVRTGPNAMTWTGYKANYRCT